MVIRPSPNRPMKQPLRLLNSQIIDARMTMLHHSLLIKLPVLIPIRPIPLPRRIVALIAEPHSDPIPTERPKLFNQPILQLPSPLAPQKFDDLFSARYKLRPIAPHAIHRIGQRNPLWITRVPTILGSTNLSNRRLQTKRRHQRNLHSIRHRKPPSIIYPSSLAAASTRLHPAICDTLPLKHPCSEALT
jgi:hypothetical protein